jgi:hypothetical protein
MILSAQQYLLHVSCCNCQMKLCPGSLTYRTRPHINKDAILSGNLSIASHPYTDHTYGRTACTMHDPFLIERVHDRVIKKERNNC